MSLKVNNLHMLNKIDCLLNWDNVSEDVFGFFYVYVFLCFFGHFKKNSLFAKTQQENQIQKTKQSKTNLMVGKGWIFFCLISSILPKTWRSFLWTFIFTSLSNWQNLSFVLPKQLNVWSNCWLLTDGQLCSQSLSTWGYSLYVCGWVRMRWQFETMSNNNYPNTKKWLLGNRIMWRGLAVKWFLKLVLASDEILFCYE